MRVLIVGVTVLAYASCAAASGLLLPGEQGPYSSLVVQEPVLVRHVTPVPPVTLPTISPGDIQGAAIDAHVEASDYVRAAVDAAREQDDHASEIAGQAIDAAKEAVQTIEAKLDGEAAHVAPILAKQLVAGTARVGAPVPRPQAIPVDNSFVVQEPIGPGYVSSVKAAIPAPLPQTIPLENRFIVQEPVQPAYVSSAKVAISAPAPQTISIERFGVGEPVNQAFFTSKFVGPQYEPQKYIAPEILQRKTISTQSLSQVHPAPQELDYGSNLVYAPDDAALFYDYPRRW